MTNSKSWNTSEEDKETWDAFFPCRTDNVGDYLNAEGSNEAMLKIGSSTQRDEIEDVETLETSEAPMENIPLLVDPIETPALEVPSAAKAIAINHVITVEPISIETLQGEVAKSEVNITTSAYVGNNCSILNSTNVFYIRC